MSSHIIFSVYQANYSDQSNQFNHENTLGLLEGLGVKYIEVKGVYNGSAETSILVSSSQKQLVERICRLYRQECFLNVDENNNAELIFTTEKNEGKRIGLGVWQQATKAVAESFDGYTQHGDEYYVCTPKNLPLIGLRSRL